MLHQRHNSCRDLFSRIRRTWPQTYRAELRPGRRLKPEPGSSPVCLRPQLAPLKLTAEPDPVQVPVRAIHLRNSTRYQPSAPQAVLHAHGRMAGNRRRTSRNEGRLSARVYSKDKPRQSPTQAPGWEGKAPVIRRGPLGSVNM